jgi:hypothetical protein
MAGLLFGVLDLHWRVTLIIINVHAEQKATCHFSGFDRRQSRLLLFR